jgi:nicotinate-nucleotide adenylyltransferase
MRFSEEMIIELRENVRRSMSDFRFTHTAEVEKMAYRIARIYSPDNIDVLRVAALLHDITKEFTVEQHVNMLQKYGENVSKLDRLSYKTLHARTAPYAIKEKYPEFACDEVLMAVRYHTTGRANMSLGEKIIFLADYIDMSRKFDDCVYLRNYFWDTDPESMTESERMEHLDKTLMLAFDMTIKALVDENSPISTESVEARNYLVAELSK